MGIPRVGNKVIVELDPENSLIETKSGFKLQIDTSYEPEKHVVRMGTVKEVPEKILFSKSDRNIMPWDTDMELKVGDRVIMYYLAVINCISPEKRWFYVENGKIIIFITYNNIYAAIRDGEIIPINGYVLVEPMEDPEWVSMQERIKQGGLLVPDMRKLSNKNVVYGKIAYLASPIRTYYDEHKSDENINVKVGDEIVMKKVRDIPMEYEYHTKVDGGRKLYRCQRHDIIGTL
jgi:co-chaperonin GroES (HSP10)